MEKDFFFDKSKNLYRDKRSKEFMSKTFYNELIRAKDATEIFKSLNKGALITATTKIGRRNAREYFSKIHNKKASKLAFISGADHSFNKKKHGTELFEKTLKFLN